MGYFTAIGLLIVSPLDIVVTKLTREATTLHQYEAGISYSQSLYDIYK